MILASLKNGPTTSAIGVTIARGLYAFAFLTFLSSSVRFLYSVYHSFISAFVPPAVSLALISANFDAISFSESTMFSPGGTVWSWEGILPNDSCERASWNGNGVTSRVG